MTPIQAPTLGGVHVSSGQLAGAWKCPCPVPTPTLLTPTTQPPVPTLLSPTTHPHPALPYHPAPHPYTALTFHPPPYPHPTLPHHPAHGLPLSLPWCSTLQTMSHLSDALLVGPFVLVLVDLGSHHQLLKPAMHIHTHVRGEHAHPCGSRASGERTDGVLRPRGWERAGRRPSSTGALAQDASEL